MPRPNFFIIGGPKCGTTALVEYLRQHPGVFFSDRKELNYFNVDFSERFRTRHSAPNRPTDDASYLSHFSEATNAHEAVGEGSVWYLSSEVAISRIHAFNSSARLIVMVRNPISMAYSLHGWELYSLAESEGDFLRAWKLQDERRLGRLIPKRCVEPRVLLYREACQLGSQLQRVYQIFPRQQVHVVVFDDFVKETRVEYLSVLRFLGLEDDGRECFPRVNQQRRNRVPELTWWLGMGVPWRVQKLIRATKSLLGIERPILWSHLWVEEARPPIPPAARDTLAIAFRDEIELLGQLLERDLSHWHEVSPA